MSTGMPRSRALWVGIAVVLAALNLRPAIVAVSPVLDVISTDLELSSFMAGMLVTLPVLCFGVLGPLAPVLAARFGFELTLAGALVAIVIGSALRGIPTAASLLAGTLFVGAGIAMGNILLPGLIKRDFSHRVGLMSGLYTMALTAGATLAAGITLPVAKAAGWEWNEALASWGLLGVLALVFWVPMLWRARGAASRRQDGSIRLAGNKIAWFVTALLGLQAFNFYSTTAWLPTILVSFGFDAVFAGLMLSLLNLVSIAPSLIVPMLITRMRSQAFFSIWVSVLYVGSTVGILVAPAFTTVWIVLMGIGQGGAFALAITYIVLRSSDARHATKLSGMAQSWGFVLAATGPLALGVIHDVTGEWTIPLLVLIVMLVFLAIAAFMGGRPGTVGGSAPPDKLSEPRESRAMR